jgi:preprotein translocase subunit SecG
LFLSWHADCESAGTQAENIPNGGNAFFSRSRKRNNKAMNKLTLVAAFLFTLALSSFAHADSCGEATEQLVAAQNAYNEAVGAFQRCGSNVACQQIYGPAAERAARELTNAGNEYNRACH